ncbi:hypothetical protein AGDE_13131 [Angomonas deanei]|uniref:Uncharacterized protein n=1 Tax=Angomonas deanei TaxID=59799 RepID=A0A7G2C6Z6_9TRYP|nr:hypothetical protein AGDE_13131 [Angomonas deanei]CAD2215506.1 hypothetical protein, conserved [Angomonas deanei]|eukprot:EPY22662.1 hypothetical protein AGDE_13131 [Angomonas deanei]
MFRRPTSVLTQQWVAPVLTTYRSIFLREYRCQATIYRPTADGEDEGHYPATLQLQWRSNRQSHVVISIQPPERNPADTEGAVTVSHVDDRRNPDYMFGRMFLRPYNVAQLLGVMLNRTPSTTIEREHATVNLERSKPKSAKHPSPTLYLLTGQFTTKTVHHEAAASPPIRGGGVGAGRLSWVRV